MKSMAGIQKSKRFAQSKLRNPEIQKYAPPNGQVTTHYEQTGFLDCAKRLDLRIAQSTWISGLRKAPGFLDCAKHLDFWIARSAWISGLREAPGFLDCVKRLDFWIARSAWISGLREAPGFLDCAKRLDFWIEFENVPGTVFSFRVDFDQRNLKPKYVTSPHNCFGIGLEQDLVVLWPPILFCRGEPVRL
jgi:hypothetical protein